MTIYRLRVGDSFLYENNLFLSVVGLGVLIALSGWALEPELQPGLAGWGQLAALGLGGSLGLHVGPLATLAVGSFFFQQTLMPARVANMLGLTLLLLGLGGGTYGGYQLAGTLVGLEW